LPRWRAAFTNPGVAALDPSVAALDPSVAALDPGVAALEPLGESANLPCPVCNLPLTAYRDGSGALFDCRQCGGQFVDHALVREMLKRQERVALGDAAPKLPPVPDPRNRYIPCPVCAQLMNRKNFGSISGVIVDICKNHGTFFDLGELPRVLAFVAGGGLERSHQRDAEEEARSKRAAHVAAIGPITPTSSHDPRISTSGSSLADMLVDLLLR
jgi:Zn-finger nucleic acid-binding protein